MNTINPKNTNLVSSSVFQSFDLPGHKSYTVELVVDWGLTLRVKQ